MNTLSVVSYLSVEQNERLRSRGIRLVAPGDCPDEGRAVVLLDVLAGALESAVERIRSERPDSSIVLVEPILSHGWWSTPPTGTMACREDAVPGLLSRLLAA